MLKVLVENVKGSTSYSKNRQPIVKHDHPTMLQNNYKALLSAGCTWDLLTLLSPLLISSWAESLDYMGTVGMGEGER